MQVADGIESEGNLGRDCDEADEYSDVKGEHFKNRWDLGSRNNEGGKEESSNNEKLFQLN
jgi:hypothetical protein